MQRWTAVSASEAERDKAAYYVPALVRLYIRGGVLSYGSSPWYRKRVGGCPRRFDASGGAVRAKVMVGDRIAFPQRT